MRLTGVELTEQVIELDGHEYIGCEFTRCTILVSGVGPVHIPGTHFDSCNWQFVGPAANALQMLCALYHKGAADCVERLFAEIRAHPSAEA